MIRYGYGDLLDTLGAANEGTQPFGERQNTHYLAESQGDDGQVVTAHAQDSQT